MKTLKEILKQNPVYLHNWKEKIDVIGDFEDIYLTGDEYRRGATAWHGNVDYYIERKNKMDEALEKYNDVHILFASYGTDNYSGDAWVLFEKGGDLFEVNGSHCSCFGLEDQWEPESVTLESIEHRLTKGSLGINDYSDNEFTNELKEFLGIK